MTSDRGPRRSWGDERGSASLEFITAGVLLIVPVVYLIVALSSLQAAAFATEGAARFAARAYVQAEDGAAGRRLAERAVGLALDDFGVQADANVVITCSPRPDDCAARESFVTVTVEADVPLPLIPASLVGAFPARVPVSAESVERVSTFAIR